MYTLTDIALLIPFILGAIYWWKSSQQKAIAVNAARSYCREHGFQFLDDSLVFKNFRLERNLHQKRFLCRIYVFDYCPDGSSRKSGEIVLSGYHVLRVIVQSEVLEITQY